MENAKMINLSTQPTASIPYKEWVETKNSPPVMIKSSTSYEPSNQVILIQGKYVNEGNHLMVAISPASIEKKLAIRELNAQLEGRTIKSQTFCDV